VRLIQPMRPVSETPTEPADYAAISAAYGVLLVGVAASARGREPLRGADLLPLSAATFALSKLVAKEKVETWVRAPFVDERPGRRRPKGKGLRYAVGELLSCTRCLGAWSSLGLVALNLHSPRVGRTVTSVLAASAGNDFLQTGVSYLCAVSNRAEAPREVAGERTNPARWSDPARS
jgi:hypothetical protein